MWQLFEVHVSPHYVWHLCVGGERWPSNEINKITTPPPHPPPKKKLNLENCFGIYLENIFTFYTPVFECECLCCRMPSMALSTHLGSYCTHRWSDRQQAGTGKESPKNSSPRLARSFWNCTMNPPNRSTTSNCLPAERTISQRRVGLS